MSLSKILNLHCLALVHQGKHPGMSEKLLVGHKQTLLGVGKDKQVNFVFRKSWVLWKKYELISLFIHVYRFIMWMKNSADSDQLASYEAS